MKANISQHYSEIQLIIFLPKSTQDVGYRSGSLVHIIILPDRILSNCNSKSHTQLDLSYIDHSSRHYGCHSLGTWNIGQIFHHRRPTCIGQYFCKYSSIHHLLELEVCKRINLIVWNTKIPTILFQVKKSTFGANSICTTCRIRDMTNTWRSKSKKDAKFK